MNRCYSCFKEFDDRLDLCPYCGEVRTVKPNEPVQLFPGTVLANRYIIGTAVGVGGFGIIYKAWDSKLETVIAVKEFFYNRIMTRATREKRVIINKKSLEEFEYRKKRFLAEARDMAKFGNHSNIPNVFEFFEENGTAYIVMELLKGKALNIYLQEKGGKINRDFALFITNEVGKALESLHEEGIIHRDVAPDNIYICNDKGIRVKLLDLGAAMLTDKNDDIIDKIFKIGYSPVEQYDDPNTVGPWIDIYSLGATLYTMLTGEKPYEATIRKKNDYLIPPHELDGTIPENLSNAVMKAMAIEKHLRFKSVKDFLKAINGEKKVLTLSKERKLRKRRRFTGIIAACLAVFILGGIVFNYYLSKKAEQLLDDATISVWFSVSEDSSEAEAMETVKKDFCDKFPNVAVELRAITKEEYQSVIQEAAANDQLPTIFESTDLPDSALENACNVKNILRSKQAESCLFLDQYSKFYSDQKRVPLAIEVPVAIVITNGVEYIEYSDNYFRSVSDFGDEAIIAKDDSHSELIEKDFNTDDMRPRDEFLDNNDNKASVMMTSTMAINDVRNKLTNYEKTYVYPAGDDIHCRFTYEWSIGDGSTDEIRAAERLLSWMLGNVYQNTLMISKASDGQIPINSTAFEEKIGQSYFAPIKEIYKDFVFEK